MVDEILDTDITITLIREQKPVKLLAQLQNKYTVIQTGNGIYQIEGMLFPMQIIVTGELERSTHIWLKVLTRNIGWTEAEELLDCCDHLRADDAEYKKAKSVVNLVSDINEEIFEKMTAGGEKMSDRLKYMILPELKEVKEQLANKDAELANKDAELANSKKQLANKDAELADKDAEIERLRRALAAVNA